MFDIFCSQAITWLHELSGVIQDKQLDVINRPHQDAQQQYEQKQVETTALVRSYVIIHLSHVELFSYWLVQ